jgi:hypothetical protein
LAANCLLSQTIAEDGAASLEYQVKAAFLLNFTKFIEWPAAGFPAPNSPFEVCVLGDDPFKGALDRIVEGEAVGAHKLLVRRVERQRLSGCRILFVGKSEKNVAGVLDALGIGTLTVGETESFLEDGGIIRFLIENRRVRFDVNQTEAKRAGLNVSSKLLQVARKVD